MDSNNRSTSDREMPEEHVEGHQMWPLDDEGIIIAVDGGDGNNVGVSQGNTDSDDHSITVYFQFRDGEVHSKTLKGICYLFIKFH